MSATGKDGTQRTRPYHSPLRERQAAETRELILDALAQVIAEHGASDFTIETVAEQAGVATRTVYRHFPNRQALLDGLTTLLDERFAALREAEQIPWLNGDDGGTDDLLGTLPAVMRWFDELEPLSTAMVITANGGVLRSQPHDARTEQFRAILQPELERVDPGEREAVFAMIRYLLGSQTWFALSHEFGLDGETAGRTVARAIAAILDDAAARG